MSTMQAFFPIAQALEDECVISLRFLDGDGKPIPFKAHTIDARHNDAIKKSATNVTFVKGLRQEHMDFDRYMAEFSAECLDYPNLRDAELQERYGVRTTADLVRVMLLPGEYADLLDWLMELNGFDRDPNSMVAAAKN